MAHRIRRVDYFYATIEDTPGAAYRFLGQLADLGMNLLAFTAVPVGPRRVQLTLFPEDTASFQRASAQARLTLDGPHPAFVAQGDDELGVLSRIHARLADADVRVYASSGVTDGSGSFGYVMYVRADDCDRAAAALGL